MLLSFFEVIGPQIEFTYVFIRTLMTQIQFQGPVLILKCLFYFVQFTMTESQQIIHIRIIWGSFGCL